eukprot:m51a1_g3747 hypothetical protein (412) ;mRNA; r:69642-70877
MDVISALTDRVAELQEHRPSSGTSRSRSHSRSHSRSPSPPEQASSSRVRASSQGAPTQQWSFTSATPIVQQRQSIRTPFKAAKGPPVLSSTGSLRQSVSAQSEAELRYYVKSPGGIQAAASRRQAPASAAPSHFVVLRGAEGSEYHLPPHWAYQCLACHPPKRVFEFPRIPPQALGAVAAFLQDPDVEALPDVIRHVGTRRALQTAAVLQLPTFFVYCLASSSDMLESPPADLLDFVSRATWLLTRPIPDWFRVENECLHWKLVDPRAALDVLWHARFCVDFRTTTALDDARGTWRQTYAEARIQNSLLTGTQTPSAEESELWEKHLGPIVTSADLSASEAVTDETVAVLLHYCPGIQYLDLHDTRVGCRVIGKITKARPRLVWINLEHTLVSRDGVEILLEHYPELTVVF